MVAVVNSSGANCELELEVWHGPDGRTMKLHSTPIAYESATPGILLEGTTSDSTSMLGEFISPFLYIKDGVGTAQQWADVIVYEMRKPF
jgi:hypothetical protein